MSPLCLLNELFYSGITRSSAEKQHRSNQGVHLEYHRNLGSTVLFAHAQSSAVNQELKERRGSCEISIGSHGGDYESTLKMAVTGFCGTLVMFCQTIWYLIPEYNNLKYIYIHFFYLYNRLNWLTS
jgi:hypothetical protein